MNYLEDLLQKLRDERSFNTVKYIIDKKEALTEFFNRQNIDAVVVPVSGGVDSAIVFALMDDLMKDGVLKQVLPLFIPIDIGTSGQDEARGRAKEVFDHLDYEFYEVDGTLAAAEIIRHSTDIRKREKKNWAYGQLASVVRTPIVYYHAAMLQMDGFRSLVCGTINRDEGSYIGFYGKASDAAVDLLPIADLHKSEVYKVADYYNIPKSIIDEKPRGDVWDNRCDEEMIGAPYWFLELYLLAIENGYDPVYLSGTPESEQWIKNINKLHNTNIHKYKKQNNKFYPLGIAKYVDVMPRIV